jgi:exoribonuclease-2
MKIFPTSSSRPASENPFADGCLVCYENNANVVLGAILGNKKDKYKILNHKGSEVDLTADRLYPIPGRIPAFEKTSEKTNYLESLLNKASTEQSQVDLATIWESFEGKEVEISTQQVCELFFGNNESANHLTTRLALIGDKVYFKRKKDTFISRPQEAVNSLLEAQRAAERRERQLEFLLKELETKLKDKAHNLSSESLGMLAPLEELAAEATEGIDSKESRNLLNYLTEKLHVAQNGRPEDRALSLLVAIGHITARTNLGFFKYRPRIQFHGELMEEVVALVDSASSVQDRLDLRHIHTFTIDDVTTKDMDDALSVEQTEKGYQIGIHISDVASVIAEESLLNKEAALRGTTIYCPEKVIHMFPSSLSQEKMSLREGVDTLCISYLVDLSPDFEVRDFDIQPSIIRSRNKLSYEEVDAALMRLATNELESKLHILNECANKLEVDRIDNGAVRVDRKEVSITVNSKGEIQVGEYDEGSPARSLVGEMMILANKLTAEFCDSKGIPCVYRAQPEPDEDPFSNPNGIPEGPAYDYLIRSRLKRSTISISPAPHSSLGLKRYTQATSPIRRYLDLIIQRQLLHFIKTGEIKFSAEVLSNIIFESESSLTLARYLSQESKRFWLMQYLLETTPRDGIILGTVVRTDLRSPLVTLDGLGLTILVDVRRDVRPGDRLALKVVTIKPQRDYIKLEEAGSHS